MSDENIVTQKVRIEASKNGMCLFRNNRGLFLTLDGKRKVRAGLEAESSLDLVGWTPITITPDMVGKKIAVYSEIEIKHSKWSKPTSQHERDQKARIDKVIKFGGISGFVNSPEKIKTLLDNLIKVI